MKFRVGIVGVSGYGGGETLRICSTHPDFEVTYVAGQSSAGSLLRERFPGLGASLAELRIEKWDPKSLPKLDVLFASLPTGQSRAALASVSRDVRIVDIGGDHRYLDGWTYGLADVWPEKIRSATRIANPGCYPSAALLAIAPLLAKNLADANAPIIIDAKSGVSGAGRGGDSKFAFAETNEDVAAYGLTDHPHVREIGLTARELLKSTAANVTFTPHLVPMTRGILATCYLQGAATTGQCLDAAREFYEGRAFVRVVEQSPHTKWATGSNLAFVSYASRPEHKVIVALCAIDNLGKGAAGQAVQNANLMLGLPETTGLNSPGIWP